MEEQSTAPPVQSPPVQSSAASSEPPPVIPAPPPVMQSEPGEYRWTQQPSVPHKAQKPWQRAWAGFLAFIATVWKFAAVILKFGKIGKLLLTGGSMLLSVAVYAHFYGWQFAVGFVICIFIHEMGHVFMAWRMGLPVSAPVFIPGMGALILLKRFGGSAWRNAIMGIGGPLFGAVAAAGCYGIYALTGNPLFLALSFTGFFMNLFNMIPMFPLDGGWITGAVSPYIWVAGLVVLLGMAVTGHLNNPFIYVLIILSLPRLIDGFKRGTINAPGEVTTPAQKLTMGVAYVALSGFLAVGIAASALSGGPGSLHRHHQPIRISRPADRTVA